MKEIFWLARLKCNIPFYLERSVRFRQELFSLRGFGVGMEYTRIRQPRFGFS
jgi:hypothetical protein